MTVLTTERLTLRPIEPGDVDDLVALTADPEVSRFVRAFDDEQMRQLVPYFQQHWREHGYGLCVVTEQGSGRFVGRSGLHFWPQFGEAEVGWVFRRDAWGNGYATEAGAACLEWGLTALRLPLVTAMIRPDNDRSIAVAERLGMTLLRADSLFDQPVLVFHRSAVTG